MNSDDFIMQINSQNDANDAEKWSELLEKVVDSRQRRGNAHQYIVFTGGKYEAKSDKNHALSIEEIQRFSQSKINELASYYLKGNLSEEDLKKFEVLAGNIMVKTMALIEARRAKRDQSILGKLSRLANKILCNRMSDFEKDMKTLKKGILQNTQKQVSYVNEAFERRQLLRKLGLKESTISAMLKDKGSVAKFLQSFYQLHDQKKAASDPNEKRRLEEEIQSHIQAVRSAQTEHGFDFETAVKFVVLEEFLATKSIKAINEETNAEVVQSTIEGTFNDKLDKYEAEEVKTETLEIFELDTERRAASFKRIDKDRGDKEIKDEEPIPFYPSTEKPVYNPSKLAEAIAAIDEIVQLNSEKNLRWRPILQLIATQTTLNAMLMIPRGIITNETQKVDGHEGERRWVLRSEFPKDYPPVQIEIIRDENHEIKSIKVTVKGQLDLVKADMSIQKEGSEEEAQVMTPNIVEASLSYTVNLTENNRVRLSDLKVAYNSTLKPKLHLGSNK